MKQNFTPVDQIRVQRYHHHHKKHPFIIGMISVCTVATLGLVVFQFATQVYAH